MNLIKETIGCFSSYCTKEYPKHTYESLFNLLYPKYLLFKCLFWTSITHEFNIVHLISLYICTYVE